MVGRATFGGLLRELRLRGGETQQQFAVRAGVSTSAIQSYEYGRRLPDLAVAERLRRSLGLKGEDELRFRRAAGLRLPDTGLKASLLKSRGAPDTVWDEVQSCRWSSLVTNERREIVAWNRLANRLSEVDLGSLTPFRRSLLRMAATNHFDSRLTNWRELIGRLISLLREEGGDLSKGPPPLYIQAILDSIGTEDPGFLPVIFDLFLNAPPWRTEARNVHPIKWRLGDGTELAFYGVFGEWSDYDGLWSFDWHAADATTSLWTQYALAEDATDITPPELLPFDKEISRARKDARLSRVALAQLSGVSPASIAAYERGQRSPSRDALIALCRALTIDGYTSNRLLREAGFEEEPSDWARFMAGESPISLFEGRTPLRSAGGPTIFREADTLSWPCAVLDASCHVVHVNRLARQIVDPARWRAIPGRPGPHLMQLMVSEQFREQVRNWTTVAGVVLPGRLEAQVLGNSNQGSRAGVRAVAEHVRKTDREGLEQLLDVWENSEGFDSLRRAAVRFEWTTDQGDALAFNCVFSNWNAYDPYKAMDLFPADEPTFAWLARG